MTESTYGRAVRFEHDAGVKEVSQQDIHFSRMSGMNPEDIEYLRMFTINEGLLIVIRCPKIASRYHHGAFPAKSFATSMFGVKSNSEGLAIHPKNGRIEVSDYDLMCVYRLAGQGLYEKIFFAGIDAKNKRSGLPPEATLVLQKVNPQLKSRFQHGAQDDYVGKDTPGVKAGDRFAAFEFGTNHYLSDFGAAKAYYLKRGLDWPYNDQGAHTRQMS